MSGTIVAKIRMDNASYTTSGELPRIGSHAPEFMLVNAKLQDVALTRWSGKRKIIYIGLSVDSETCARTIIRFDEYVAGKEDVALLVVSCDLPFAHKRFAAAHDLQEAEGLSAVRHAGFGDDGILVSLAQNFLHVGLGHGNRLLADDRVGALADRTAENAEQSGRRDSEHDDGCQQLDQGKGGLAAHQSGSTRPLPACTRKL